MRKGLLFWTMVGVVVACILALVIRNILDEPEMTAAMGTAEAQLHQASFQWPAAVPSCVRDSSCRKA